MYVKNRNFPCKHAESLPPDSRGFTLVEIMVVIVIIGILAAIVSPRLMNRLRDAKVKDARVQILNLETALRLFSMDNGFYPTTDQGLQALAAPPTTGRIPEHYRAGGYLQGKELPSDPWGNEYIYFSPGTRGDYEIISYGEDGQPGGEDYKSDISNWDLNGPLPEPS